MNNSPPVRQPDPSTQPAGTPPFKIVIDPGHGRGNRSPGVLDPGCVLLKNDKSVPLARECDLALAFAEKLDAALRSGNSRRELLWTRRDNIESVSLRDRAKIARNSEAALLISLHINAAPEDSKGEARGFEILYSNEQSGFFAEAIRDCMKPLIALHGEGVVWRNGLYVLRYKPSVLLEMGFIDHDEDYALLSDPAWQKKAMHAVATAVKAVLAERPWGAKT